MVGNVSREGIGVLGNRWYFRSDRRSGVEAAIFPSAYIVEPEALVRFDMIAFFEERGWRVYEAEDADQAMDILDERKDIRVVLIDAMASGRMDGLKLAHYIRERFPPTLLFMVTGNTPVPQDALPQRATFFPKPFDLHRVMRQIEQSPVTP